MSQRSERGSVTVVTVTLTVALMVLAGMVHDGGRIITAQQQADATAEAAARAAAQELDESSLRNTDTIAIDADRGRQRALAYLADAGYSGSVEIAGADAHVTVQRERPTDLLSLIGIGSVTIHGEGASRAVRGVVTEGD